MDRTMESISSSIKSQYFVHGNPDLWYIQPSPPGERAQKPIITVIISNPPCKCNRKPHMAATIAVGKPVMSRLGGEF